MKALFFLNASYCIAFFASCSVMSESNHQNRQAVKNENIEDVEYCAIKQQVIEHELSKWNDASAVYNLVLSDKALAELRNKFRHLRLSNSNKKLKHDSLNKAVAIRVEDVQISGRRARAKIWRSTGVGFHNSTIVTLVREKSGKWIIFNETVPSTI